LLPTPSLSTAFPRVLSTGAPPCVAASFTLCRHCCRPTGASPRLKPAARFSRPTAECRSFYPLLSRGPDRATRSHRACALHLAVSRPIHGSLGFRLENLPVFKAIWIALQPCGCRASQLVFCRGPSQLSLRICYGFHRNRFKVPSDFRLVAPASCDAFCHPGLPSRSVL